MLFLLAQKYTTTGGLKAQNYNMKMQAHVYLVHFGVLYFIFYNMVQRISGVDSNFIQMNMAGAKKKMKDNGDKCRDKWRQKGEHWFYKIKQRTSENYFL